jgi:hypothetical protein
MDKQLLKRLRHTVQHYVCIGEDDYGDKTYAPPVERKCYQEVKFTTIRNRAGQEVTSAIRLYFDGIVPVSSNDKFTVDGEDYPVLSYNHYDGLKPGTGTTVVYL